MVRQHATARSQDDEVFRKTEARDIIGGALARKIEVVLSSWSGVRVLRWGEIVKIGPSVLDPDAERQLVQADEARDTTELLEDLRHT